MSQASPRTDEEAYAAGFVPTRLVAPLLRRGLISDFGGVDLLDRSELPINVKGAEALPRILFKWENEQEYAEYDAVDRALAKVNMLEKWRDEQPDAYYRPVLSDKSRKPQDRCEGRGCTNIVKQNNKGGVRKRFCSPACRQRGYKDRAARKRGQKNSRVKWGTRTGTCAHGHDRSPENTGTDNRGQIYCKACTRERMRAHRRKLKLQSQGGTDTAPGGVSHAGPGAAAGSVVAA